MAAVRCTIAIRPTLIAQDVQRALFFAKLGDLRPVIADRQFAFVAMVGLGLTASILDALAVSLASGLFYAVAGGSNNSSAAVQHLIGFDVFGRLNHNPWLAGGLVAAVLFVRLAVVAAYGITATSIKTLVFHRLRERLYRRYMFAPYGLMSQKSFGFLTNTIQVEAPRAAELIDQLFRMPINGTAAIVFFVALFALSWPVAGLTVIAALGAALSLQLIRKVLHQLGQRAMRVHEELASRMLSGIQSLRTIRAFGAEHREFVRFAAASRAASRVLAHFAVIENGVGVAASLTTTGLIAIVIVSSSLFGNPVATTLTMLALLYRLQPHLLSLQGSLTAIYGLQSSLDLIVDVIRDDTSEGTTVVPSVAPLQFRRSVRFRDVSFTHPNSSEAALHHLDFEIAQGSVTAVVGRSGAGKTTIINLLVRLYEPSSGSIEIDGTALHTIDRAEWLQAVAIAGQDVDVLAGSVLENLRLGAPELSTDQAWDALETAGIRDLVRTLPQGLDTPIGERGYRLSGGQRQRVALARALAKKPSFLILDEATNAVDALLETEILDRIRTTFPTLTILVVAHRSSALAGADALIEIAGGRVKRIEVPSRTEPSRASFAS